MVYLISFTNNLTLKLIVFNLSHLRNQAAYFAEICIMYCVVCAKEILISVVNMTQYVAVIAFKWILNFGVT